MPSASPPSGALKSRKQRLKLVGKLMSIPREAIEAANAVAESLDAAVFVYSGTIDSKGFGRLVEAIHPSDDHPARRNSVMFLTTHGGQADQAYRIARLLQTITEKFYLCVPTHCKSAGTLIALGANEIFMQSVSELGPLDVQLRRRDEIGQRRSGMVVRTALDGLAEETFKVFEQAMLRITVSSGFTISFDVASRVASEIATGVMAPVYAQVDPESLGNDLRDLSVATAYGERLVEHGGNATNETVRKLVEDYPTHEFIIDREEVRNIFKTVREPNEEMVNFITSIGDIIYSVQSPHVILRADRNLEREEDHDGDEETSHETTTVAADVDQGRKAARRGDRQRKREGKAPSQTGQGDSDI